MKSCLAWTSPLGVSATLFWKASVNSETDWIEIGGAFF
jgi:hypothetical protein